MKGNSFSEAYTNALEQGASFVLWRNPDSDHARFISCPPVLNEWQAGEAGFIFHPFHISENSPLLFFQAADIMNIPLHDVPGALKIPYGKGSAGSRSTEKKDYLQFVAKSIEQIRLGKLDKVVAARSFALPARDQIMKLDFFKALCLKYPAAFVYLLHSPVAGSWMGASPELLLRQQAGELFTMALAGTASGQNWSQKEHHEQELVKDYILDVFSRHQLKPLVSEIQNLPAGEKLFHLLNHIRAVAPSDLSAAHIRSLTYDLHPTPAVGGLPKEKALQWIKENEGMDRRYYSGFLGSMSARQGTDLFVNLRCMSMQEDDFLLYAGAGITADSDPEKEWLETERKMQTLISVMKSFAP